MEFNARYALTGLFTLLVAFAILAFVYWLNNSAGFGEQSQYRIRYPVAVSGLSSGSDVLFNGLKVGEVTGLGFDSANPGGVIATISVMKATPIRTDTVVGIDFQGLTGAASILMTGGTPDAPMLESVGGEMPVLDADPGQSRSWTQKAGRVLGSLDDLLSRNSGKFDAIISGLERLAGGGDKTAAQVNDLEAAADFPPLGHAISWQLVIGEPTVLLTLNTDKVLQQTSKTTWQPFGDARWTDNLPNLFQAKTIQSFENAGFLDSILRPADSLDPDYRLLIDLRMFHFATYSAPEAVIDFVAKITDRDGAVIASRQFRETLGSPSVSQTDALATLNTLFSSSMKELVAWTAAALPG
jgi:phospholipid/cholesterol/gamma-HCH transport system substrate-binding protein